VENTLDFALALRRAGVRFDLHIYENGAHGLGLGGKKNLRSGQVHGLHARLRFVAQERGVRAEI